ncbi:MAG TPA: bifunctional alpha/beta hydrolase/class I SAM-dependent methyltransferase [Humisphaera sp.]|nr:bifunctional alpha/beta hydrolase/class I SAM-dependent methyltransferase [Humisphaera sp.]
MNLCATEHTLKSWDGAEIFYRAWIPDAPASNAVLLFHRGHEHSARWQETVDALDFKDVAVFAWDQRGHGRSPGERGSAENLAVVIKDSDVFARHVCATHGFPMENVAVVAHSVGAVIATAWVHDYAPPIRALVLATPAFRVKLYIPLAIPALRLKKWLSGKGGGIVKSYVKAKVLTHDSEQQRNYEADPMIFRQIAVNILLGLFDTSTRLLADAGAITVPTLILAAENDWVVKLGAQQTFYRGLSSRIKQMEIYPGFYHAIFHERDRASVVRRIRTFLDDAFTRSDHRAELLDADKGGYTRTEYDLLRGPTNIVWRLMRTSMKTGGMLSDCIRLGWKSGFDSGVTLDRVYENKPAGITPLGKLIDYFYLNSIGWRGIRIRRQNLQNALRDCIETVHQSGRPVRLLDIASGPGRYILETMQSMQRIPISATLRDYQQINVDAARKLSETLGIADAVCCIGDAFDRASLAGIAPRPTIAIVSGLYELIPENDRLAQSLGGIADALEDGGYLIYTSQPWHPQVEFIARVLTNREGQPWIMRRRTQAEMDALVRAAGFEKISQEIDLWGIFTVSVAQKRSMAMASPSS